MKIKYFIRRAFSLGLQSEELEVCRYSDGAPLTVVNLRKTYFSPAESASVFELDFNTGAKTWTLEELITVLLTATLDGEINADKCEIGGNATERWIDV